MTKPHTDQHKKGFAKDGTPIGTPPPHSHFYLNCVCREIVTNNPLIEDETSSSINSLFLTFHIHTHSLSLTLPSSLSRSLYLAHSISLSHFLSLSLSLSFTHLQEHVPIFTRYLLLLPLSLSLILTHRKSSALTIFSFQLNVHHYLHIFLMHVQSVFLSLSFSVYLYLFVLMIISFQQVARTKFSIYFFRMEANSWAIPAGGHIQSCFASDLSEISLIFSPNYASCSIILALQLLEFNKRERER